MNSTPEATESSPIQAVKGGEILVDFQLYCLCLSLSIHLKLADQRYTQTDFVASPILP